MTKCMECNESIAYGQRYIEVRQMPDDDNPNVRIAGFAHWPQCPTRVTIREDGHAILTIAGQEVDMGPIPEGPPPEPT